MEKWMIVDGSNLLFQMFYGMPARITGRNGKAIQGTLGLVGALLKMLRMVSPTHIAVLFDGECANERRELDADYKANRPDYSQMTEDDTPFSQLPDIFAALTQLGIPFAETTDCEADDWIAGYAAELPQDAALVIVSQDSDFFQLIDDRVSVLRYRGQHSLLCDTAYIREKLGIEPAQYAAYKSLTGDTADNIRGADKIGPKTAAELMRQFGTLDALLAGVDQIRKPSVQRSVQQHAERLLRNYRLIALTGSRTLPLSRQEMVFRDSGLTTTQVLQAIGLR